MGRGAFNDSLADTQKRYIVGQVRVKQLGDKAVFHIQVNGPKGNRPYGYALDVPVTAETSMLALAFALSPTTKNSLAGTDKRYWVAQFRNRRKGTVNMQTAGIPPFAGNRPYGNALEFVDYDFNSWLDTVLG